MGGGGGGWWGRGPQSTSGEADSAGNPVGGGKAEGGQSDKCTEIPLKVYKPKLLDSVQVNQSVNQ